MFARILFRVMMECDMPKTAVVEKYMFSPFYGDAYYEVRLTYEEYKAIKEGVDDYVQKHGSLGIDASREWGRNDMVFIQGEFLENDKRVGILPYLHVGKKEPFLEYAFEREAKSDSYYLFLKWG